MRIAAPIEFRSPDNTAQPYPADVRADWRRGSTASSAKLIRVRHFAGDVGHMTAAADRESTTSGSCRGHCRRHSTRSSRMNLVCAALGPEILKHFLAVKRGELETYNTLVHDWERSTYLELQ